MIVKNVMSFTVICFALTNPELLYAGAGAQINACIYLPTKPVIPLDVNFKIGSTHCMNSNGHDTTLKVTNAGVSCASIGYVEGKSSSSGGDLCATGAHHWNLGYAVTSQSYSGNADISFDHPFLSSNYATFNSSSSGTGLCSSDTKCIDNSQQWDSGTVGNLYIIYNPTAQTMK